MQGRQRRDRWSWRRLGATLAAAGWAVALAAPAMARPGFGVRGGGSAPAPSAPRASSPSVGGSRGGGSLPRSDGSVRFDRPTVRPGFGRNPNYRDGGSSRSGGSRDRFFDPGSNAGSYRFRDGGRRRNRIYYYEPYPYAAPYYSPFSFGFYPYDGVFSYYDWYTGPYRQYGEQQQDRYDRNRVEEQEEDRWPSRSRGNVQLDIQPRDVEVRIDGVLTTGEGRGFLDLPSGTYRVEVSRPGYRTWETELVVRQGIRYRIETKLERLPGEEGRVQRGSSPRLAGELILDTTPKDVIVKMDGRLLGVADLLQGSVALRSIPVGSHQLELSRPGYRTVTREITVDAREPLKLKVQMDRQ
jgi:PEGA domain